MGSFKTYLTGFVQRLLGGKGPEKLFVIGVPLKGVEGLGFLKLQGFS